MHLPPSLLLALTLLVSGRVALSAVEPLSVYWIDSEGGGSTLLVTPGGESVLVDSGNPGVRDPSRIVHVARDIAGLKRIDHYVTTHFHTDHFGGAAEVAAQLPIGTVWDNGIPERNPDNNPSDTTWLLKIRPYREFKAGQRKVVQPGDALPLRQSAGTAPLAIRFLAARQQSWAGPLHHTGTNTFCANATTQPKDTSDNANSVALLVELGAFRYFIGGDMTWNVEANLVCPSNHIGTVDVYQVNHHGLDVSNNPLLVKSLAPTVSVMNNGATKGTGAKTLQTLRGTPSIKAMYQVHKNLRADSENNTSDEFIANLEKECAGNHIRMTVNPDGKTYRFQIPGREEERQFETRPRDSEVSRR